MQFPLYLQIYRNNTIFYFDREIIKPERKATLRIETILTNWTNYLYVKQAEIDLVIQRTGGASLVTYYYIAYRAKRSHVLYKQTVDVTTVKQFYSKLLHSVTERC